MGIEKQVGMTLSRHAVNTSLYALRQPSWLSTGLESVIPTCFSVDTTPHSSLHECNE